MNAPIPVREGESLPLSALGAGLEDTEVRGLSRELAHRGEQLRRELGLREDAIRVYEGTSGTIVRFSGIAGTMVLPSVVLDIRPKYVMDAGDRLWASGLLAMHERSARKQGEFGRVHRSGYRASTFIDQLAMALVFELEDATRHAEVRAYRASVQELSQVRGRMLVTAQLRSSLVKPHKVICEVDELHGDNPVNRLLHWAVRQASSMARDGMVRRRLSDVGARLPTVSEPVRRPTQLSFRLPRQYRHYFRAVEIAEIFARGLVVAHGATAGRGASLLVGTERLFESFLEAELAAALGDNTGWSTTPQVREVFAHAEKSTGMKDFYSKPDNLVSKDAKPRLIIDAKYKRFADATNVEDPRKPSNADIYQMVAACVAHGCRRALLVYPATRDDNGLTDWTTRHWTVPLGDFPLTVGAVAVPLHMLASAGGAREFKRKLGSLVVREAGTGVA